VLSQLIAKTNIMKTITIRDLYPHLSDEDLEIAEDELERYLALVMRIYNRIIEENGYDGMVRIIEEAKANGPKSG
jgi:hypothetical protein